MTISLEDLKQDIEAVEGSGCKIKAIRANMYTLRQLLLNPALEVGYGGPTLRSGDDREVSMSYTLYGYPVTIDPTVDDGFVIKATFN